MKYRVFGRTGWKVSEVSFGAWAIGGAWGDVDDRESKKTLRTAIDNGVNFIDTADAYGDGRSERLIREVLADCQERVYVATKAGRRLPQQTVDGYTEENLTRFVERSLQNLGVETLDLVQLHCPPTEVYYRPEVFAALDKLTAAGKIRFYGVSVQKVEEGLKAIEYPHVASVQIIYNMFRHRPAERFFARCREQNTAVIARVPLASGLLTGKFHSGSSFAETDHRHFNRYGEKFDRGETFAGVDYDKALFAVAELEQLVPAGYTLAQLALRWILMAEDVSCVIPGAKRPDQVEDNVGAAQMPPLDAETMAEVERIYKQYVQDDVHHRW